MSSAYRFLLIILLSFALGCRESVRNSEVIHGMIGLPSALMPSVDNDLDAVQIYSQIYETLLVLGRDFKTLKPHLCLSWEMDSLGKSFTFRLRRGIVFHDGSKLNAAAVKYSVDWLKKTNPNNAVLNNIQAVKVYDDSVFAVILKEARPAFIYAAASPSAFPLISPSAIKKYGKAIARNPVGSGPFKLYKWRNGDKIILKKNCSWWKSDVNINHIIFKGFDNYKQIEENLKSNHTDIAYAISGYSLDRLKWMGKINYAVNKPISTIFIGFNLKNEILSKKSLRKALVLSLNTQKIVNFINRGNADISNNPLPKILRQDSVDYPIQFNPALAREILIKEGYKNGLTLNLYYPKNFFTRQTYIEAVKTAFKKVGITLNITAFDSWIELERAMKSNSSQIFIYGWGAEILGDAGNFLQTLFYSSSKRNFFHYHNKYIDKILDKALLEPDKSRRADYYKKAVQLIMEDIPAVFLMHVKEFYAYNKEKIKSVTISPYGTVRYDKIILR